MLFDLALECKDLDKPFLDLESPWWDDSEVKNKDFENKISTWWSLISLLMEIKFLVIWGMTRTYDKGMLWSVEWPIWVIGKVLPLPKPTKSATL